MSQPAGRLPPLSPGMKSPPPISPRPPVFYAIVQHDFIAERADELDAKAGDHISVVAQSNYEWFVAKPISRLGRPGLIPVSFVAVHDPTTGRPMTDFEIKALMERGEVPGVEDWKKSILEYKASSIPLGTLDDDNSRGTVANSPYAPKISQEKPKLDAIPEPESEPQRMKTPMPYLSRGIILAGEVLSWHFEEDEYWFRIHALFQPDPDPDFDNLPPAKQLVLFRGYNDFYDFQVNLLDSFPFEAGRVPVGDDQEPRRILPYMPGPSQHVDDKVTQLRKDELDQYLSQLCALWEVGGEHILRSRLVLDFFMPKTGDVEEEVEPAYKILEERAAAKQYAAGRDDTERMRESFLRMNVQDPGNRYSDGSNYDERGYASSSRSVNGVAVDNRTGTASPASGRSHHRPMDQQDMGNPRSHSPYAGNHQYSGSTASALSRSISSRIEYEGTTVGNGTRRMDDDSPRSYTSSHAQPLSAAPSTGSAKSRARSNTLNSPPISANNPNKAYIKIKIFDQITQDIIAIRVHPRVTHEELMRQARGRLGDEVRLAYRNSITNTDVGIDDDESLEKWLRGTDKHILYTR